MIPRFRSLGLVLALVLSERAIAQSERIPVPSCPHADSLLGPLGEDSKGIVRRRHKPAADSTYFITGLGTGVINGNQPSLTFLAGIGFPIPRLRPDAELLVILRGRAAASLTKSAATPGVNLLLDDAAPRPLAIVTLGEFNGAPGTPVTLPVSAAILSDDLLALARADRAAIVIETVRIPLSGSDQRDLRALYRAAACEHPD